MTTATPRASRPAPRRRAAFLVTGLALTGLLTLFVASCGGGGGKDAGPAIQGEEKYPKILLIGMDGATWEVIDPLMAKGSMPNLKKLVERGVRSDLQSQDPMKSPMIWTTVATGKDWRVHGIFDFNVGERPVSSNMRQTKAVWNILSEAGRTVGTLAYLVTFPTEEINGFMVSDRAYYGGDLADKTYPSNLLDDYGDFMVWDPDSDRSGTEMRRFVNMDIDMALVREIKADLDKANARLAAYKENPDADKGYLAHYLISNRLNFFFAKDESVAKLAEHVMKTFPTDLLCVYLQGADIVSHGFWKFFRPWNFKDVPQVEVAQMGKIIPKYYEYLDEKLGQILRHVDDETIVILCSDHGFQDWQPRENDPYWYLSGNHRTDGILVMAGPHVKVGERLVNASVLDITPTILYLMGMQIGADMTGRVLTNALDPDYQVTHPIWFLPSYDVDWKGGSALPVASPTDAEEMARLRALGYVQPKADPPKDGEKKDGTAPQGPPRKDE